MKATIFGKIHRQGTSKAGNPYDFIEIHYSAPKRKVEGLAAITKTVDSSLIRYDALVVPAEYLLEHDDDGNVVSIVPVGK